jgi:hypothetical protein
MVTTLFATFAILSFAGFGGYLAVLFYEDDTGSVEPTAF